MIWPITFQKNLVFNPCRPWIRRRSLTPRRRPIVSCFDWNFIAGSKVQEWQPLCSSHAGNERQHQQTNCHGHDGTSSIVERGKEKNWTWTWTSHWPFTWSDTPRSHCCQVGIPKGDVDLLPRQYQTQGAQSPFFIASCGIVGLPSTFFKTMVEEDVQPHILTFLGIERVTARTIKQAEEIFYDMCCTGNSTCEGFNRTIWKRQDYIRLLYPHRSARGEAEGRGKGMARIHEEVGRRERKNKGKRKILYGCRIP